MSLLDKNASRPKEEFDYGSSHILVLAFFTIFIAIVLVSCLVNGVIPGPELIVLCFFIYAAYDRRSRRFVKDWFPFISALLCYEALNALVPSLAIAVHVAEPINADMQLFGSIPTLVLQQFYRAPILDYLGAFFYSLHFIIPILFALILWKYYPKDFGGYTLAFVIGTFAALTTYIIYPTAPPWFGVDATRILFQLDNNLGLPSFRSVFDFFRPNPFAAFPSLHAMYPWLISLYAFKIRKLKALPVLIIPIGIWFSSVYLGEHYVIDIVGGVIYGTCAFLFVEKIVPLIYRKFNHKNQASKSKLYSVNPV